MHRTTRHFLALASIVSFGCTAGSDDSGQAGTPDVPIEAATSAAMSAEQREAVATLQALFDAMYAGDRTALERVVDPSVVMHFVDATGDGAPAYGSSTVAGLAARIEAEGPPLIERMWDPAVSVEGDLATIWTPYDFYVGEEFTHCGMDAATLVRQAGAWRIVGLSWTRARPPACSLHPDGPPAD